MKNVKASIALLMLMLMTCAFIEMFNHPTDKVMMFLITVFTMSAALGTLALRSANK